MATVYNKTALKKIKKDELIQMFLDKQAKLNDIQMDAEENNKLEKVFNPKTTNEYKALFNRLGISYPKGMKAHTAFVMLSDKYEEYKKSLPEYSKLKEENEKLREAYEDQHKYSCEIGDYIDKKQEEIEKLKEENEKLKAKLISKSEEHTNTRRELSQLEAIMFEHIKNGCIKYEQTFL
jgi:TusA-related sulfurtransferase